MAWKTRPIRFNLKLVRAVRKALARGEDCGLPTVSHHLVVATPGDGSASAYTISLLRDDEGTCMATCREVSEVLVFAEGEEKALAACAAAIRDAVASRGSASRERSADPAAAA